MSSPLKQYVDGFLLHVPTKKLSTYRKMATLAAKVWIDHGALDYRETVGDDLAVPFGLPFPKRMGIKKTDTVIFAWVVYPSKAARKKINALVMKDSRMKEMCDPDNMPFDPNGMSWGGFKTLVSAQAP